MVSKSLSYFPGSCVLSGTLLRFSDGGEDDTAKDVPCVHLEGSGPVPSPPSVTPVSPGEQAQVAQARRSRHHQVQVQEPGQIPTRGDFSPLAALDKFGRWWFLTKPQTGKFSLDSSFTV